MLVLTMLPEMTLRLRQTALTLRAVYCSERLPRFFKRLQALYTADIREADGGEIRAAS